MTDNGISNLIFESLNLHSIIVCDTSFGIKSIKALCSGIEDIAENFTCPLAAKKNSDRLAYKLQMLHMGGCKGKSIGMDLVEMTLSSYYIYLDSDCGSCSAIELKHWSL